MDIEKLKYLLNDIEEHIVTLIENVLSDSEEDPHFSAVTVCNRIKCYIQVMNDLKEELPYKTVEEFLRFNAFTEDECVLFEKKRKSESIYYIGKQY